MIAALPQVSLPAERLIDAGPIVFTNSMALGIVGTLVMSAAFAYTIAKIRSGQHSRLSIAVLWTYESLLRTTEEVMGSRAAAKRIAPLAITIFFFVIINNWLELVPFVGPLTWHGEPLFRGLASDLNFTLSLAIITMVTAQVWAVRHFGFGGNLGRYFVNPLRSPMQAFIGLLELIAEFSRLIALSMRLFGNIFGGEVLLVVIAFITSWFAPLALPVFMALELFVGAIQAYIFFMLTIVFVSLGTGSHSHEPAPEPQLSPTN